MLSILKKYSGIWFIPHINHSYEIHSEYSKFTVDAIYKLTGDYDCIDRIARLHFFSGSLENILSMKDADYGIIGLLTADDERISYYLSNEQSEIARLKGKYLDLENKLLFIKTKIIYRCYA